VIGSVGSLLELLAPGVVPVPEVLGVLPDDPEAPLPLPELPLPDALGEVVLGAVVLGLVALDVEACTTIVPFMNGWIAQM
jgi:hypothetical protein